MAALTVLIVLGGRLFLVLRGSGDDGLQIEADTVRVNQPPRAPCTSTAMRFIARLQLKAGTVKVTGVFWACSADAAARRTGVQRGSGTETCATHFLTVDRHRNGIVRVGGQLQVAACLITGRG